MDFQLVSCALAAFECALNVLPDVDLDVIVFVRVEPTWLRSWVMMST